MRCRLPSTRCTPVLLGVLCALVVLHGLCSTAHAFRNLDEGAAVPEFQITSLGGTTVSSADLRGKTVVLAFVRLGQEKSLEALRGLAEMAKEGDGTTEYLAVVTNPEEGDVVEWTREVNAILAVFPDNDKTMYGTFGVVMTPSTGIIGPEGTLVRDVNGYTSDYGDDVARLVRVAQGLEPLEQEEQSEEPVEKKSEERKTAERSLEKARLLADRKMKDKAVIAAEEAVAADGDYLDARVYLADLLLDVSDENADRAVVHYEKVLVAEPNNNEANVGLARVKSIQGDHEQAAQILARAALLNPKPEKIYYELGRVYERAGNPEKAVEAYRKALDKLLE